MIPTVFRHGVDGKRDSDSLSARTEMQDLSERLVGENSVNRKDMTHDPVRLSIVVWLFKLVPVLPIVNWLSKYTNYWSINLRNDFVGGLTVGSVIVPQGVAYAKIALLPVQFGLYASFMPGLIYSFWGTCGQASIGPSSSRAQMSSDAARRYVDPDENPDEYLNLMLVVALEVGVFMILMGISGLGIVSKIICHPVVEGIKMATFLIIGVRQLKFIVGVTHKTGHNFFQTFYNFCLALPDTSKYSIAYAVGTAMIILILNYWRLSAWCGSDAIQFVPSIVVAVALGITFAYLLPSDEVSVVGEIQSGFFTFGAPKSEHWVKVLPDALTLALLNYVEDYSLEYAVATKRGYQLDPTRELYGMGFANFFGAFFQSFTVTSTGSRLVVGDAAGSRTVANAIFQWIFVLCTLLFLSPVFEHLPEAVLGTIILISLLGIVHPRVWPRIATVSPLEIMVPTATVLGSLFFSLAEGIGFGVAISFIILLTQAKWYSFGILFRPRTLKYARAHYCTPSPEGTSVIFKFPGDIHFLNFPLYSKIIEDMFLDEIEYSDLNTFVLDMSNVNYIDVTVTEWLCGIQRRFETLQHTHHGSQFYKPTYVRVACIQQSPRKLLRRGGYIGDEEGRFFPTTESAARRP